MLGTFEEIAIRGIVNDHFSVLSGCVLLKKFENEKSLPHILLVVFIIGFSNLIIISTKRLKRTKKIFTHNLPRVLPTICLYPQSGVNQFTSDAVGRAKRLHLLLLELDSQAGHYFREWAKKLRHFSLLDMRNFTKNGHLECLVEKNINTQIFGPIPRWQYLPSGESRNETTSGL